MNLFSLLQRANTRLKTDDPAFHEATETTVAILRSSEVLPTKRSSINGAIHHLISAAIVEAYDNDTSIDIPTRSAAKFHYYGYSTKLISYLDKAVKNKLLLSKSDKAKGSLAIGEILETYLAV